MTEVTRRTAILGATTVLYGAGVAESAVTSQAVAAHSPSDEARWAKIAALYPVTRKIVQLENAYWGSMAEPVAAAHREQVARLNRDNSCYARRAMIADQARAKKQQAETMGVQTGVEVLVPDDPDLDGATTSFRLLRQSTLRATQRCPLLL